MPRQTLGLMHFLVPLYLYDSIGDALHKCVFLFVIIHLASVPYFIFATGPSGPYCIFAITHCKFATPIPVYIQYTNKEGALGSYHFPMESNVTLGVKLNAV